MNTTSTQHPVTRTAAHPLVKRNVLTRLIAALNREPRAESSVRGEARRLGLPRPHGRPFPGAAPSLPPAAGRGLSGWRMAAGPLVVFAALLALPLQAQAQIKPIPTLQCDIADSRELDSGGTNFDATLEIRPSAFGFDLDAIQVTKPSKYSFYLMAGGHSGEGVRTRRLRVQLLDAVTGNSVPYEDARGQFSLQIKADSFTSTYGVYNEASNILRFAFHPLATMPDASATHGTDGTIDFTVTLDAVDDCRSVTVDWATADGTATAGEDYSAASGTLTFGPGETSKTIRVALLDTADVDGAETFSVQLGNASDITLDDAEAIGTISAAKAANVAATGKPTVTGTARVGETLAASASDIADDDGLANATFAWQWIADDADIAEATEATYTLTSAEVGKTVTVRATFTDDRGAGETALSDATAAVEAAVPPAIVAGGVQVTSTPRAASDTYGPGETIELTVTFDKAVTVDTTGGIPRIQFRLGPPRTDRWAAYSGGSGNTALTFTYEVQSGDTDSNGIRLPKNELQLRSGTIRDAATNTADAILDYARAGLQSGHKVDGSLTNTPAITAGGVQVTSTPQAASDTYGSGETITLTVTFDKAVTVDTTGGIPRIQFRLGPPRTDRWAAYSSGSGNAALTFTYEVQSGDTDSNGIWLPKNELQLQSGTIRDAATNTADAILDYARAGLQSGHKVDGSLTNTPAGPIPTLQCSNDDSREYNGNAKFDAALEISPAAVAPIVMNAIQVTNPTKYLVARLGVAPLGELVTRTDLYNYVTDAVTRNNVPYEDARGQFSLQVRADSFTSADGVYNEASNILRFAFHPLATMPDASATHGTDGTIDFTVTLDAVDDCRSVTVDWATADGTATAGEDYAAASGTLTFGLGETSKTIRVALLDTADVDGAETFSVQLGNASDITLDDAEAIGTISGVKAANVAATGKPTVTGTARVGETLTASASDIADDDGLTNATFAWQWIADDADIAGATEATYTLTSAEMGKTVKVRATFTDDRGTEETVLSDATAAVTTAYTCMAPNLAGRTEVWTGTLAVATVESGGTVVGYGFNRGPNGGGNYGVLSDTSFDFGGTSYTIASVVRVIPPSPIPGLVVMLDKSLPDTEQNMLWLHVCGDTFDLASVSVNHPNHSNRDKRYWWANPGIDWSSATTVSLALSATALGVSVGDAQVREGPDAALAFRVTLDRASSSPVTVDYATQDGTAVAAADYTATSGTLTFVPGETAKTVTVAVLDDAHDEGAETLTLTLSNATGAHIEDATATGTIVNSDPLQQAWLARFGRTVGSQVMEAVSARLDGNPSSHLTVAGVGLDGAGTPVAAPLTPQDWLAAQLAQGPDTQRPEERLLMARELLLGSSFHLVSQADDSGGPALSAWGRVATGGFRAEVDGVAMDGSVTTGFLGFDAEWQRLLAGLLLARSEGDGDYSLSSGDDSGTIESALTGVYPYARLRLGARLSVWGLAGVGSGDLTLIRQDEVIDTGLGLRLGAIGVEGTLLEGSALDLVVKSDALWVRTDSDAATELAAASAQVSRLRLILEGSRTLALSAASTLTPTLQVGLRHDGGDAETGTGLEVGAGLRYLAGVLTIEAQVRTLLAHEAGGYEEWGVSGAIRLSPDASGLGASLAVLPAWGVPSGGVAQLWSHSDASALVSESAAAPAAGRLDAELGYGLPALRGRGVLTPYARLALLEGDGRSWHLGTRLALDSSLNLSLEGSSRRVAGGETVHDLALRASVPW